MVLGIVHHVGATRPPWFREVCVVLGIVHRFRGIAAHGGDAKGTSGTVLGPSVRQGSWNCVKIRRLGSQLLKQESKQARKGGRKEGRKEGRKQASKQAMKALFDALKECIENGVPVHHAESVRDIRLQEK
eukprot:1743183-Amphidinium_carterae.1